MTFKAEFTFDSLEELQEFIGTKTSTPTSTPNTIADKKDEKSGKVTKGPKPEPVPVDEKPTVPHFIGKKHKEEKSKEEKTKEDKITYDYVKQATLDAVKAAGREAVKEMLNSFGVSLAPELTKDQWPEYMKRCGELIKSASAEKTESEEELA